MNERFLKEILFLTHREINLKLFVDFFFSKKVYSRIIHDAKEGREELNEERKQ